MGRSPVRFWASIVTIMVVVLVTDRLTDSFVVELLAAVIAGLVLWAIAAAITWIADRRRAGRTS
jgi:hypothetical protein